MASTYSDLKIELIGTGEQTGTWGTTTNDNFSIAIGEAITGSADVAFSSADVTVTLTNTNASQAARNLRLNLTGTSGGARNLILGSGCQIEKLYLINNGLADAVTVKNTSGTGIAVPAGKTMFVYNNGTNVVDAITYLSAIGTGVFDAGTVSAPSITTTGDTNTGIFFPAADTIAFTEGGVESMRIDSVGQVSISANNTTNGLRITQLGTGNALLVEDSTNPDATPFVIDAIGTIISGNATSIPFTYASAPKFEVVGTGVSTSAISSASYSGTAGISSSLLFGRGRGTPSSPTIVNSGDDIGLIQFEAHDGTALIPAASILGEVDGTPGTNDMPGRLVFSTTADGASTPTERMRITSSGFVTIGGAENQTIISASNYLQVQQTASGYAYTAVRYTADINPATLLLSKSRGSSVGSNTIVQNGDSIGILLFAASDGTTFIRSAIIDAQVDGTPGTNDMPGRLVFSTTADGSDTPTERMRITSAGNIGIATDAPAAKLQVAGNTILSNVDMLNASYDSVSFSVAGEEITPTGLFFSPDGSRMFVIGTTGDDVNQYSLSTPWVVSSASYVTVFSVSSQDLTPNGLFFRADGLKMYVLGTSNDTVFQYSLTTPWSVATATYDSVSFSVATEDTNPTGIFFKPNGLTMYVVGSASDNVNQYTLSTAWNVSTATFTQSFSVGSQETAPADVSFTGDGTRMFVSGTNGDDVTVYDLTTPWDISTSFHIGQFSVALQDSTPNGIYVKPDGTKFYIAGSGNDSVYQYTIPSIDIQLTGTTAINGGATVAQDLTVDGNFSALNITTNGSLQIARTAVTSPATTDGNIFSGTYTPTLTNSTNVASSTASELQYMRVGSVVTVSGLVGITPTAASDANTVLRMSLPISSTLASTTNLSGTGVISSAAGRGVAAAIYADTTNNRAEFNFLSPSTSGLSTRFTFTYRII